MFADTAAGLQPSWTVNTIPAQQLEDRQRCMCEPAHQLHTQTAGLPCGWARPATYGMRGTTQYTPEHEHADSLVGSAQQDRSDDSGMGTSGTNHAYRYVSNRPTGTLMCRRAGDGGAALLGLFCIGTGTLCTPCGVLPCAPWQLILLHALLVGKDRALNTPWTCRAQ